MEVDSAHNQAIIDLIVAMADMVDYVVDIRQFATIAKLKVVLEEANQIMRKAVEFVKKHSQRSTFRERFWEYSVDLSI